MNKSQKFTRTFVALLAIVINLSLLASVSIAQTSRTVTPAPLAECLRKLETEMKATEWISQGTIQRHFFGEVYPGIKLGLKSIPEMKSIAASSVTPVNKFLRENGFNMQLRPLGPSGVAVAALMKISIEWREPGMEDTMGRNDEYPAVHLEKGTFRAFTWRKKAVLEPIARGTDHVYMVVLDRAEVPADDLALYQLGSRLAQEKQVASGYTRGKFPMVDLNDRPDVSWFEGLQLPTEAGVFTIRQSLQQTKFMMDERGAQVESAAAMGGARGLSRDNPLLIDGPFLLVVTRDGVQSPIMVAWVEKDAWKRPARR